MHYENSFKTKKSIFGEKTPSYCYLQFAMDRIYNYNLNIKLILILREPISRAFSQYNMDFYKSINEITEEQTLKYFENQETYKLSELEKNGAYVIIRGFYDEIIEYIVLKFNKKNLYIGVSEEIKENKPKYYNEIFHFLGATSLELEVFKHNIDTHVREYKNPISKNLEKKLYKIYEIHNIKLYKLLGRKLNAWETYYENIRS